MLIEFFVEKLLSVASFILGFLPEDPEPFGSSPLVVVTPWFSYLNGFLPLAEVVDLVVLTFQVMGILGTIWIATYILRRLHIIG